MEIKEKVINENIRVHKEESTIYDSFHIEIYNWYEKQQTNKDIFFLKDQLSSYKEVNFLDVGCGTGNISLNFLDDDRYNIVGVDLSPDMIKQFAKKIPQEKVNRFNLVNAEIEEFLDKNRNKYDLITISSVLYHLHEPFCVFDKILSIIDSGGIIYLTHEPLVDEQKNNNIFSSIILLTDKVLSNFYWLYKFQRIPKFDYSVSDYHDGLDLERIKQRLSSDFDILYCQKYNVNRIGFLSFLSNIIGISCNFKIIAKKRAFKKK